MHCIHMCVCALDEPVKIWNLNTLVLAKNYSSALSKPLYLWLLIIIIVQREEEVVVLRLKRRYTKIYICILNEWPSANIISKFDQILKHFHAIMASRKRNVFERRFDDFSMKFLEPTMLNRVVMKK